MPKTKYKVIIAGGRDFDDYNLLKNVCNELFKKKSRFIIVSGKARGADNLGERFAKENEIEVKEFPANWGLYGKRAGFLRNEQMAEYANYLVAFWDGKSKGTKHMINLAKKKGLKVKVVRY